MPLPKRTDPFYQAQDILSRRDHSEFELRTKLRRKRFSPSQIDDAVAKLKKLNLINDEKFADNYAANILLFKPVGPRWIKHKLKQKGIAPSVISQTIESTFSPGREEELAAQAAATWWKLHPLDKGGTRGFDVPPSFQGGARGGIYLRNKQRLTRHLASRGFSFAAIESVIR